jgi:transcriptional regulator of acetoin/glycerol metabolism
MGQIEGPAHADHVLKVIAGNDAASSALAASLRRSGALHALDPASRAPSQRLPEDEIARSRERMGSLLFAAEGRSIASFSLWAASGVQSCSLTRAGSSSTVEAPRATTLCSMAPAFG